MVARLFFASVLLGLTSFAADWRALEISSVWSGHPVGFDLLTTKDRQYVAFYDADRRMTVAGRALSSEEWQFVRLPSQLGWDSHNYVTMAQDRAGQLHLSGNMHVNPLVYFRTTKPGDIASFTEQKSMVGREEARCTYPRFLRGPKGELIFTYRDGRSGSGNQIYNVYDEGTRQWSRLLDSPLTDGEGKSNAYFADPVPGPDGYFHLVWVWRNTPDCSTNHDLTYARSKDLRTWETSAGKPLRLPIRIETAEIVDPVPVKGGMINGNAKLGFDSQKRPVITYHKYDEKGFTQIYNARLEDGQWKIYRTTDWDYRWEFSGGGSIHFEIRPGAVRRMDDALVLDFAHDRMGSGTWRLDEATLRPVETRERTRPWPMELEKPGTAGMQVHLQPGKGGGGYLLRWETLGPNRDRPRTGDLPAPSMLRDLLAMNGFVTAKGTEFQLDGARFPVVGVNCYFLGYCSGASREAVLGEARALGTTVIRAWAFHDAARYTPGQVTFQYVDNGVITVNEGPDGLQRLDAAIADAEKNGIKLILPFVDHWDHLGGMPRYLEWLGLPNNDGEFYRSPLARSAYRNWVRTILTRHNRHTGRLYLEEPAIMAWELANEPRCTAAGGRRLLLDWIEEMSEYVKSIDANHLVACGDEGFFRRRWTSNNLYDGSHGVDCEAILDIPSLDFGTYHMYPDHWEQPYEFGFEWIADHAAVGRRAGKPVLLGEYGVKSALDRNAVVDAWLRAVEAENGAGSLLWMLGGEGGDVLGYRDAYTILRASDLPALSAYAARVTNVPVANVPVDKPSV